MEIVNFSITPKTAIANGADIISASAVIMNGNDYVSNEPIVFRITSGSAIFSNGLSSIVVSSNSLGAVSASLVDTVAENIVIEIALQNDASVHNSLVATFTQSDNTVDTINILLTIDDAKADGEDQNQVELQTFSGAVPVSGTAVSATLTNGAVFISGEKTAKIKTGSNGRASQAGKLKGKSDEMLEVLSRTDALAQNLGLRGTPGMIVMPVNGASAGNVTVIPGGADQSALQAAIDKAAGQPGE